jgi:molybdopterin biosynthesis enzyme
MNKTEEKLLKLKKEIEEGKFKVSELKGTKSHLIQTLKKKWGCSSVEEAQEKIKEFEEQIEKYDKQIEKGIKELEDEYDF